MGNTSILSTSTSAPMPMFITRKRSCSVDGTDLRSANGDTSKVPLNTEVSVVMLVSGTENEPYTFPKFPPLRSTRSITSVPKRMPEGQLAATRTEYSVLGLMI